MNRRPFRHHGPERRLKNGAAPALGLVECFPPGDRGRVDAVLEDLRGLDIEHLRTVVSWADYETAPGRAWYEWLLPRLADQVRLLPCFTGTPAGEGITPKSTSPPRDAHAFERFLNVVLERFGSLFSWIELWNEPNNLHGWDRRLDPGWEIFAEMIIRGAAVCRDRGKKVVLGGMCPVDESWLDQMGRAGVLGSVDAVGVHGFPGTWENDWEEWDEPLAKIRRVINRHESPAEMWITAAGYSTWQHNEFQQLREFVRLLEVPAARVFWYAARDLFPSAPYLDIRHAHFGLVRSDGSPKLLCRIWRSEGTEGLRGLVDLEAEEAAAPRVISFNSFVNVDSVASTVREPELSLRSQRKTSGHVLITGGAGFIGTNLADRLLSSGGTVRIFDNLSRPGVEQNLRWLRKTHGDRLQVQIGDVRNVHALAQAVAGAEQVYHFASQVAVTTSLDDPVADFEINLRGTLNLLEALRDLDHPPPLLFTSTNKVYGELSDVPLTETSSRYEPTDHRHRTGIGTDRPLEFHSPYGCSKGGGDQYVLDYARIRNLPAVVFRMSCIYGPHQFGNEDQGWVAHFLLRAIRHETITLYGDGKQVRDLLFVDDLIDAMLSAMARIDAVKGRPFNIGGGTRNTVSLLELLELIGKLRGERPRVSFDSWRPGDQRYYVSDTREFERATGWRPKRSIARGVRHLHTWLCQNRKLSRIA